MCIHQNYMYVYLLLIHLLSLWTILWQYFRRFALFVRTENSFIHLSQTAHSVFSVHVVHFFSVLSFFLLSSVVCGLFCCRDDVRERFPSKNVSRELKKTAKQTKWKKMSSQKE